MDFAQLPELTIPDDAWEDNPGDHPERSRLTTIIRINGALFHLDARQVTTDAGDTQEFLAYPHDAGLLADALGGEEPWETLTIAGRPYAVFASPFCQ